MAGKFRHKGDLVCASRPHLDTQWNEWLFESCVLALGAMGAASQGGRDSEVPAVPVGGGEPESAGGGTD